MSNPNPVPFELRVANTNPHSKFSGFEIVSVIEVVQPRKAPYIETIADLEGLVVHPYSHSEPFYILYGRYADFVHPEYGSAREIQRFENLTAAKELLVELNGPIEEDQDSQ